MIYLFIVNGLGAAVTAYDKLAARRGAWRVRERTLFVFCVLGSCPGVYAVMRLMHHKTRHLRFMLGIPLIFAAQCAIAAGLWYYGFI